MYHLIFQSRKPEARKFRKWVTAEVLPSLRRTGRYEVKHSIRLLPRDRDAEMGSFFDELTKWTTPKNERMVAELMHVTAKHVHEVVCGRTQSYGVCCLLVEQAAENRRQGIRRVPAYNRDRRHDMEQLRLEFMEG